MRAAAVAAAAAAAAEREVAALAAAMSAAKLEVLRLQERAYTLAQQRRLFDSGGAVSLAQLSREVRAACHDKSSAAGPPALVLSVGPAEIGPAGADAVEDLTRRVACRDAAALQQLHDALIEALVGAAEGAPPPLPLTRMEG